MRVGFMAFTLAALVAVPTLDKYGPLKPAEAADPPPPLFSCTDLGIDVSVDTYDYTYSQTFRINAGGTVVGSLPLTGGIFKAIAGTFTTPTIFNSSGCTAAATGRFSDLPNIIGGYSASVNSVARAINSNGAIVGWIGSSAVLYRGNLSVPELPNAVVWTFNTVSTPPAWEFTKLNNSTYSGSVAFDINNAGEIVGAVIDSSNIMYAAYWASASSAPTILTYTYAGQSAAQQLKGVAEAINAAGNIAGRIFGSDFLTCNRMPTNITACSGEMFDSMFSVTKNTDGSMAQAVNLGTFNKDEKNNFRPLGGWGAKDINNSNVVVGSSHFEIHNPYIPAKLPSMPPGTPNPSIGVSWAASQPFAYFSSATGMTNIGSIDAIFPIYTPNTWANAINDHNYVLIAGFADTNGYSKVNFVSNQYTGNSTGNGTQFVWEPVAFLARYVAATTATPAHWTQDNLTSLVPALTALQPSSTAAFISNATDIDINDRIVAIARFGYTYKLVVLTLSPLATNVIASTPTANTTTTTPAAKASWLSTRAMDATPTTTASHVFSGAKLSPGDIVTATLNYTNLGPQDAANLVVRTSLQPSQNVDRNSIIVPTICSLTSGSNDSSIIYDCTVGTLVASQSTSFDITFRAGQNMSGSDVELKVQSEVPTASVNTGVSTNATRQLSFKLESKSTPSTSPNDTGSTTTTPNDPPPTTTPPASTDGASTNSGSSTTSSKKSGFGCTLRRGGDDVDVSLALLMLLASGSMIRARRRVYFKN